METAPRKRGRPRVVKMEKRSPEPEDLEAILQDIDDDAIDDYDYIPNGVDYEVIKNKKNINNNEDVYDFDVEKEDGPGIIKPEIVPEPDPQEHACNICPRTFKTLPGLKRHKTSHDRKPQEPTVLNDDSMKKELNNCDCCGEDLATAHTNGDFECYDCGNFFKLKVNMERHQLMVHCYDDI
ncbi:zinc finger protein 287-like [Acyrthosiphon pisum]|nr:zinc finger protein 287-like [Acyrthosiphon pisum]